VRFLVDAMFSPEVVDHLNAAGHEGITPRQLGAPNLGDHVLVDAAARDGLVIVTENIADFAHVRTCAVVFVLKAWWPGRALPSRLAAALDRWALANPEPGLWARWMEAGVR
jgi:hypothetical protein